MARKNVHCVTAREQAGFEKLVELHDGNEAAAFEAWEQNGFRVPDEAMALVGDDVTDNEFVLPDKVETDPQILSKQNAVRKAKALMTAKVKKLNTLVDRHPELEKGRELLTA